MYLDDNEHKNNIGHFAIYSLLYLSSSRFPRDSVVVNGVGSADVSAQNLLHFGRYFERAREFVVEKQTGLSVLVQQRVSNTSLY